MSGMVGDIDNNSNMTDKQDKPDKPDKLDKPDKPDKPDKTRRFGIRDVIFLSCILMGLLCVYFSQKKTPSQGKNVVVTVAGEEYVNVPLVTGVALTINIDKDGVTTNVLHVENGAAYITDADCPDKVCEKTGKISRVNESIVCLPNKVVVTITGDETADAVDPGDSAIDAVSGK